MAEIEIRNLSKSFDNHKVLDDISLKIEKGDIYGVLGLSGAGKSTLVRCINGLETFDEGEILLSSEGKIRDKYAVQEFTKRPNLVFRRILDSMHNCSGDVSIE